jgi:hypothetical protein
MIRACRMLGTEGWAPIVRWLHPGPRELRSLGVAPGLNATPLGDVWSQFSMAASTTLVA